jgi:hypothetical protein
MPERRIENGAFWTTIVVLVFLSVLGLLSIVRAGDIDFNTRYSKVLGWLIFFPGIAGLVTLGLSPLFVGFVWLTGSPNRLKRATAVLWTTFLSVLVLFWCCFWSVSPVPPWKNWQ